MAMLGPLAFVVPWALIALVLLPLLWWLLKVVPPMPRRVSFPAIRLLFGLDTDRRAAESTPLWLTLLRITLVALLILAVSHPLLNPSHRSLAPGDMLVVVDDGWASARDWPDRMTALRNLIALAERQDRMVAILTTAPRDSSAPMEHSGLLTPQDTGRLVSALVPSPWPVDRAAAAEALGDLDSVSQVFWMTDGVATDDDSRFLATLQGLGELTVMNNRQSSAALSLLSPTIEDGLLVLRARRAGLGSERYIWVAANDADGNLVARQELIFANGAGEAEAALNVPSELRNKIARLEIENEPTAAAAVLLDQRWKRPPVGLVAGGDLESQQPLLSPTYFLERALENSAQLQPATLEQLLAKPPAVIVLADIGVVPETERETLETWIDSGGVLIRFAGPVFSQESDDLVPVEIRGRERALGGAMSWASAQRIAPFDADSPFAGLLPPPDVLIDRQVLAEPTVDLTSKTWARLLDGTPLVTAEQRGDGWLGLVHTSANTQWTNLPISGLFAGMMKRLIDLSQGAGAELGNQLLPALQSLTGFGVLGPPPPTATAIGANSFDDAQPSPETPPGLYGTLDLRRTLNLGPTIESLEELVLPAETTVTGFERREEIDTRPFIFGLAALLALLEIYASMALRGLVPAFGTGTRLAAIPLLILLLAPDGARAEEQLNENGIPLAALNVRFAYIETGDSQVDRISFAGLRGLGMMLTARTSVEPGDPIAVEIETDDIMLFPLIYWAITPDQPIPSGVAKARLDAYLAAGGILVVDTRDADEEMEGVTGTGTNAARLPELLGGLNIPALMRVPAGHVLTQAYYILGGFPGRWDGGSVWVEQHPGGLNDGVSAILIGSNDWASAWALNDELQPLYPVVPGGERQREMAFRFGINLAMYAMTGNYKADAVHLPMILERIGQ
ncbi:MAG: DUF4159 domain-containing protein [Rhodospirillaceae bacterium]|nr:DUF4159 domain-containing protein [Rhodospirillaceae bacterium]MBT6202931.1 DUF4159 domain-containing protein [Rhodospirillaceae bacterium]MBT6509274.1 DUF4159 domain-containing protein [Rhodospirillaceae bacterium]